MALVVVAFMIALVAAPIFAVRELLSRRRSARPGTVRARRTAQLGTGALVAWTVIPLAVIGLWALADALTENSGNARLVLEPAPPALTAGGLAGTWTTSSGGRVTFTGDGRFAETGLPAPPKGNGGDAGLVIPKRAAGTWQLSGSRGYQEVVLAFSPADQLGLTVTWQPVSGGQPYFVLQLYLGSGEDMNPAYELTRHVISTEVAPP